MSDFKYLIFGSGRQGTAAAYDLIRFGEAERVILADQDLPTAQRAAERVNYLTGTNRAFPLALDVTDSQAVDNALKGINSTLSAVPYFYNLPLTQAAIRAYAHYCDLGGNTEIVRAQLALDQQAKDAGVSIVPDCGMGPGLVNTLGAYAIELLDQASEVYIYDAGLPQEPIPPWNYQLTFHINGLTNEMDGDAIFIRDGEITYVPTLTEPEWLEFPGLGRLEADVTSGGTSIAAWTYLGQLDVFENKVLRYPGHYEWLRAFKTLGLFSETPIDVNGQQIVPRQVYHTLLEPQITADDIRDICVMRSVGKGLRAGQLATVTIDLIDRYDEKTGFTGMERLTGWHAAIMMAFQAQECIPAGGVPVELAVPASEFMEALRSRGIDHTITWS